MNLKQTHDLNALYPEEKVRIAKPLAWTHSAGLVVFGFAAGVAVGVVLTGHFVIAAVANGACR